MCVGWRRWQHGTRKTATVTILFEGLTMEGVPFVSPRAGEDQVYWLPSVGELGVLFSPAGDIANAVFMPSLIFKDFPGIGEKHNES